MRKGEIIQSPEEERRILEEKLGYPVGPIEYAYARQDILKEVEEICRKGLSYHIKKSEEEGLYYITPETNTVVE